MARSALLDHLEQRLGALDSGPIAVAFSGGLDSTALLHALATLPAARARGLRAIHVDHALHADSPRWAEHCQQTCANLGLELRVVRVEVRNIAGLGLEAAAREARFAAFESALGKGEILAFAHHRDDQVETVLLKLLRGAGPEGLAAMREWRRFGHGHAWRPLLDLPRQALLEHGHAYALDWVDDPSNADARLDRNRLRHTVLPLLRERWPGSDAAIVQSAQWMRHAADFIESESQRALARIQGLDPATIDCREWLALPAALRDPVLRMWLRDNRLPEPNRHQVDELVRQLAANAEAQPCVRWPGAEVRRYRELAYALAPQEAVAHDWEHSWSGEPLELPGNAGRLSLSTESGSPLPAAVRVRFRRGGERIQLAGASHHRDLRDLFQEAGIPPWQRGRLPILIDAGGELLAVADLWSSAAWKAQLAALGADLCFEPTNC